MSATALPRFLLVLIVGVWHSINPHEKFSTLDCCPTWTVVLPGQLSTRQLSYLDSCRAWTVVVPGQLSMLTVVTWTVVCLDSRHLDNCLCIRSRAMRARTGAGNGWLFTQTREQGTQSWGNEWLSAAQSLCGQREGITWRWPRPRSPRMGSMERPERQTMIRRPEPI